MSELEFRELEKTDLELLRRWRMLPKITKYLFSDPVITAEGQRQWYKEMKERGSSLFWIFNFEDVDIGYAALSNIDEETRRGDLNIYIGEADYRGRGLSKKMLQKLEEHAFEILHFHKLCARVFSENYPALMAYLKNGWKIEGVLRDHVFKHDRFYDVYMVALLKEEWIE